MSATNLDLPVLISADQIRRREFVTIRRGYDPDQVRAYLEQLADQIELMRVMLREAQQEAEAAIRTSAQPHEDPYDKLAQRVSNVIREADSAAETIRGEAATDAERLTREARADADRIRTDAQTKAEEARSLAEEAVRNARKQADRTLAGLSTRRDALVDQLASMQERLIGVARDLESAMDVQVTLPALASIDDLFDESTPGHERRDEPASPADAVPQTGEAALEPSEEAEGLVVIGAADGPAYDHAPEDEEPFVDPSYEELWEGTDAMKLDLPDIPALDLDWGEEDDPS
ncbi:MAG TPA: DivIVA domain-containing protein [Actinomycetota bacterium]|nr:DivIVA domain-containing protein [Actinomycetota bacterium]